MVPMLITPNGWSTIIGLLTLLGRIQAHPFSSAVELNFLTSLARWKGYEGYYNFKARSHMKIMEDIPKQDH